MSNIDKTKRRGLIIWVYSIRQVNALNKYGVVYYKSKRMQYVYMYVNDDDKLEATIEKIERLYFVRSVEKSWLPEIDKEGETILQKINVQDFVIALAIEGDLVTSEQMAQMIERCGISGQSRIVFVIGGSLGLSDSVKRRAQVKMSFGRITLPHQLMRLVLSEQIYRSFRIMHGQSYHK